MEAMVKKLKEMKIDYIKRTVGEEETDNDGTAEIDQLFFNDPVRYMIEICNRENLKLVPADSKHRIKFPFNRHNPPVAKCHTIKSDQSKFRLLYFGNQ
jgi:hypothetical protein